jgi:hemerythrin-like domain-containing protein
MMDIIEALIAEHRTIEGILSGLENEIPGITSVEAARNITNVLMPVLARHGNIEREIAYKAFDHALAEKGELYRFNQEHEDLDANAKKINAATTAGDARERLKIFIQEARDHFRYEEQNLFPRIRKVLPASALEKLGEPLLQPRA